MSKNQLILEINGLKDQLHQAEFEMKKSSDEQFRMKNKFSSAVKDAEFGAKEFQDQKRVLNQKIKVLNQQIKEKEGNVSTLRQELDQSNLQMSELDSQVSLRDSEILQLKKQLA